MAFSEIYEVSVSVFLYLKAKSLIHYLLRIVGWVVVERNVSVVFSGELDNGH
jgi:phage-related protein